jgi:two-component system, NtrC family, response regulator AtoC
MKNENGDALVVDDDPDVGKVLEALLLQAGITCRWVPDVESALAVLRERPVDVVITDLRMPGPSGLDLLEAVVERWPDIPVALLTAHGTLDVAVEASVKGAADFLRKPFDREEVLFTVRKLIAVARHGAASASLGVTRGPTESASPRMREVEDLIRRAAAANATVLLRGENGTGKDVAAQAIHRLGPRQAEPFVRVHCAAFPETLIESELFGYEKGAFAGAASRRFGRVEIAGKGTLLLDEIGDVSLAVQVKLLRLLQEKEFERLGSSQTLKSPARFMAATHQPLEELIERGTFREDLFFRLNVLQIWIPPLRERPEDVEALAHRFCAEAARNNGRGEMEISAQAVTALRSLPWPGNVRELQNCVERMVILSDGNRLTVADVERQVAPLPGARSSRPSGALKTSVDDYEKEMIRKVLVEVEGNKTKAAARLKISRRTLYNKLYEFDLL